MKAWTPWVPIPIDLASLPHLRWSTGWPRWLGRPEWQVQMRQPGAATVTQNLIVGDIFVVRYGGRKYRYGSTSKGLIYEKSECA